MMERFFLIAFSFIFFNMSGRTKSDFVLGSWLATDKSVAVEVYKINDEFRAKVLWFNQKLGSGKPMQMRYDTENPNPALRKRKILGMEILEGLQYNSSNNSWENGKIYDATSGKFWDSSASLNKDGTLKVRGFWKFKWIGKSMSFKKISHEILTKL